MLCEIYFALLISFCSLFKPAESVKYGGCHLVNGNVTCGGPIISPSRTVESNVQCPERNLTFECPGINIDDYLDHGHAVGAEFNFDILFMLPCQSNFKFSRQRVKYGICKALTDVFNGAAFDGNEWSQDEVKNMLQV